MYYKKNASYDQPTQNHSKRSNGICLNLGRRIFVLFVGQFFNLLLLFPLFITINSQAQISPLKEFRGVWIATVNNIDWPSAPGLPVEVQKKELKELIERIERYNLNAVILQVRPAADAFYRSRTEPWSYFLTGKQGLAPSPLFDPLAYAIELCHLKGMELHAWFNPFRVRNNGYYQLDPGSFAAKNPKYTVLYDNKLFLDPGIPQVRNHIVKVIMEVVRTYDIDAIHFDDYFYPYPVRGKKYPDSKTFAKYGKGFYPKRLNDWRRENINKFIHAIHDSISAVKSPVKLGISPFGVWRNKSDDPNGSPGVKATTSYDHLFADVYKWMANDWIDYIIPQLYWEQGNRFGDFTALAKWWNDHCFGKELYLGQALFRSTGRSVNVFTNPIEIGEQISILRKFKNVGGFAFYSASHLAKLSEGILSELYTKLLPTKVNTPQNTRPFVIVQEVPPQEPQNPDIEKILADETEQADESASLAHKSLINKSLPIPDQFEITKSRKGWVITWKTTPPVHDKGIRFSVILFEPVKGGDTLKTVYITTELQEVFIPRKFAIHPSKVRFGIVSINNKGDQGSFTKLFRIRGRRIILN